MPKRKKKSVDPEILKELEELDKRAEEDRRKNDEVLALVDQIQLRLRQMYARR
ncbi:MAG: hypothetical protein ACRDKS_16670 [Actinomycetota bacterium]